MSPEKNSGFTLVELIISMVVVTLLVAVMIPAVGSLSDDARLRASAAKITGLLNTARTRSISQTQECIVLFETGSKSCNLSCSDGTADSGMSSVKTVTWEAGTVASNMEDGIDENLKIIYYPDGSSSGAEIALRGDGEKVVVMEVFRATSLVYGYEVAKK